MPIDDLGLAVLASIAVATFTFILFDTLSFSGPLPPPYIEASVSLSLRANIPCRTCLTILLKFPCPSRPCPHQDSMIVHHEVVEHGDFAQRQQVVRWVRRFPFKFLSDREYTIARRMYKGADGALYGLTKVGRQAGMSRPERRGRRSATGQGGPVAPQVRRLHVRNRRQGGEPADLCKQLMG